MTALIEAEGLFKSNRHNPAPSDPQSLALDPSDLLYAEGPNGSGKSTLLRMIAGVARPSGGRLVRRGTISYLPHPFDPPGQFRVLEYIVQMAKLRGRWVPGKRDSIVTLLERFGLSNYLGVRVDALSSGNLRRVGLAQAFVVEADVLILDEPANGLDFEGEQLLAQLLKAHREAGGAALIARHPRLTDGHSTLTLVSDRSGEHQRALTTYAVVLGSRLMPEDLAPLGDYLVEDGGPILAVGDSSLHKLLQRAIESGISIHSVNPVLEPRRP